MSLASTPSFSASSYWLYMCVFSLTNCRRRPVKKLIAAPWRTGSSLCWLDHAVPLFILAYVKPSPSNVTGLSGHLSIHFLISSLHSTRKISSSSMLLGHHSVHPSEIVLRHSAFQQKCAYTLSFSLFAIINFLRPKSIAFSFFSFLGLSPVTCIFLYSINIYWIIWVI